MNIMSMLLCKNNGVYAWSPLFTSCWGLFIGLVIVMYESHLHQIPRTDTAVILQGSSEQAIKQQTGPQRIILDREGLKGYSSCLSNLHKAAFLVHTKSL